VLPSTSPFQNPRRVSENFAISSVTLTAANFEELFDGMWYCLPIYFFRYSRVHMHHVHEWSWLHVGYQRLSHFDLVCFLLHAGVCVCECFLLTQA
jgi:hypothetical protein